MKQLLFAISILLPAIVFSQNYSTGQSYHGTRNFIEYIPGDLPILLTAPHGGKLKPNDIPDINGVTHVGDGGTLESTLEIADQIEVITGHRPHVIINHVVSKKALFNHTDIDKAAGNHPDVRQAFYEYQNFTEIARKKILSTWGKGHFFEMHSNAHDGKWTEFGYGVSGNYLDGTDAQLLKQRNYSTIQTLCSNGNADFLDVLRGPNSLGTLLQNEGYNSIPSSTNPRPLGKKYFFGNHNLWRYGSNKGGTLDGTHIESYYRFVNISATERKKYSAAMAKVMVTFVEHFYSLDLNIDMLFPQIKLLGKLSICEGDTSILEASPGPDVTGAVSYQWLKDGIIITGETSKLYHAIDDGEYSFVLKNGVNSFTSKSKTIATRSTPNQFFPPLKYVCEPQNITLETPSQNLWETNWYDDPLATNKIHSGHSYTTNLNASKTYYLQQQNIGSNISNVGLLDPVGISKYTDNGGFYLKFEALSSFELISVEVHADGSYERSFELLNEEGIVEYKTIFVPDGESRVNLNFKIQKGENYLIGVRPSPRDANLYMSKNDSVFKYPYPYVLKDVVKINGITNDGWSTGFYSYLYDWEVKQSKATCHDSISALPVIVGEKPENPITQDQTICKGDGAILTANITDQSTAINWHDKIKDGNLLGQGPNLSVNTSQTTTYYVETKTKPESKYIGLKNNNAGSNSLGGEFFIRFTTHKDVTIRSTKLYANGAGDRTILLLDNNNNTIVSKKISLIDGEQRVSLDINVPAGSDYKLGVAKTANLQRNNKGVSYPYVLDGLITMSSAYSHLYGNRYNYYYYLYDWEVVDSSAVCASERTSVVVNVDLCVSTDEIVEMNKITISPNPAIGQVRLSIPPSLKVQKIEISNSIGQQVYSSSKSQNTINISHYNHGIYYVTIYSDNSNLKTLKLVKK